MLGDPVDFVDPEGLYGFDPLTGGPTDLSNQFYSWLTNYTKGLYGGAAATVAVGGMCMAAPPLYYLAMRNPVYTAEAMSFGLDLLNQGTPASSPLGQAWYMGTHLGDLPW